MFELLVKTMRANKKYHPFDMDSVEIRLFDDGSGRLRTLDRHGGVDEVISIEFSNEEDMKKQLQEWIDS